MGNPDKMTRAEVEAMTMLELRMVLRKAWGGESTHPVLARNLHHLKRDDIINMLIDWDVVVRGFDGSKRTMRAMLPGSPTPRWPDTIRWPGLGGRTTIEYGALPKGDL